MKRLIVVYSLILSSLGFSEGRSGNHNNYSSYNSHQVENSIDYLNLDLIGIQIPKYANPDRNAKEDLYTTKEVLGSAVNYFVNQLGLPYFGKLCVMENEGVTALENAYKTGEPISIRGFKLESAWKAYSGWDKDLNSAGAGACIDGTAFNILTRDYPYYCRNGNHSGPYNYRLDWLIYRLMDTDVYHKTNVIPKNNHDIDRLTGQLIQVQNPAIPRIVINNSLVTQDIRAIGYVIDRGQRDYVSRNEIEPTKLLVPDRKNEYKYATRTNMILSFDFNKEVKRKAQTDFRLNPVRTDVDAVEGFFIRPNGLWDYIVYDVKNDQRLNAAPGGVADFSAGLYIDNRFDSIKAHSKFNSIRNGIDCMICHTGGIISSDLVSQNKNIISAFSQRIQNNFKLERDLQDARIIFDVPEGEEKSNSYESGIEVKTALSEAGKLFRNAVRIIGTSKEGADTIPLLPDFHAVYSAPLTLKQAAEELGTSIEKLKSALDSYENNTVFIDKVDRANQSTWTINREIFEKIYCDLYESIKDQKRPTVGSALGQSWWNA